MICGIQWIRLRYKKLVDAKESIYGLDILTDLVNDCNNEISKIQNFKVDKPYNIGKVVWDIEDELNNKTVNSFTTKSLPSFNSSTGGISPSDLIGIAGSYKSGKTTFGLNLVTDFVKQGIPCGFFSL